MWPSPAFYWLSEKLSMHAEVQLSMRSSHSIVSSTSVCHDIAPNGHPVYEPQSLCACSTLRLMNTAARASNLNLPEQIVAHLQKFGNRILGVAARGLAFLQHL